MSSQSSRVSVDSHARTQTSSSIPVEIARDDLRQQPESRISGDSEDESSEETLEPSESFRRSERRPRPKRFFGEEGSSVNAYGEPGATYGPGFENAPLPPGFFENPSAERRATSAVSKQRSGQKSG